MEKTYSLPNQQNVPSGFLQTRFVVLYERLKIREGPARETERREGCCDVHTVGRCYKNFHQQH